MKFLYFIALIALITNKLLTRPISLPESRFEFSRSSRVRRASRMGTRKEIRAKKEYDSEGEEVKIVGFEGVDGGTCDSSYYLGRAYFT